MRDFERLREANMARQDEWLKGKRFPLHLRMMELFGEVGELCNVLKKRERQELGFAGSTVQSIEVARELGDVFISADLLAMDLGYSIPDIVSEKFNLTSQENNFKTRLIFK